MLVHQITLLLDSTWSCFLLSHVSMHIAPRLLENFDNYLRRGLRGALLENKKLAVEGDASLVIVQIKNEDEQSLEIQLENGGV